MRLQSAGAEARAGARRTHSWIRLLTSFVLAVAFVSFGLPQQPAQAYEVTTGTWATASPTSSVSTPSGVTITVTGTGLTTMSGTSTLGARGWDQTQFAPTNMLTGDSAAAPQVNTGSCASTGACPGLGTLTITFSQPVRNPVLHLAGMGGATALGVTAQSDVHAVLDLTTAGVTLSKVAGNTQLSVSSSRITAANDSASPSCTSNTGGTLNAAATAACGSVRVNGTVSSVAFTMSAVLVKNPNAATPNNGTGSGDAFGLAVTLPQDFGDAPATYNVGQAPAHVIGDLLLGSTIDEDNPNTRNATASPFAGAAATGDDTDGSDDEDALTTLPNLLAGVANTYTLTVPLAGVARTAYVCGYIDLNRGGTFDTGTERACATVAAGATSASLSWSAPATTTVGTTNARFRLGYTQSQVQSPTGLADSGEVEDYPITFAPRPTITLNKTTLGGTGGPFVFTLTNTVQNSGTVTTSTAGAVTQVDGDTGTGGTQAFTVTAINTNATINETTIPTGWALSGATCTNAVGAVVGSLSGSTYTVPGAALVPGAAITCGYINGQPKVTLDKVSSAINDVDGNGHDVGDTVAYTFLVTNTGQTPLASVGVTDAKVGTVTCPATSLTAGVATTCTATYTLTQADVNAGQVVNTATATGTPPTGPAVSAQDTDTRPITRSPAITLVKTAGAVTDVDGNGHDVGDTVSYSFLVTNTGNVTLTSVGVTDPKVDPVTCSPTTLAPGAAVTCTKAYTLTQADVDAGVVNNTATASGTPPAGGAVTATSSASRTITRTAAINLDKQAGTLNGAGVGATIPFSFVVTNTGNVTLTTVTVNDPKAGAVTCPVTTLSPGAATTCTTTYTVTQSDVDAGGVNNSATATGTPPAGMTAPTSTDTTSTPLSRTPGIALDKQTAGITDTDGNGQDAGDLLNFSFLITNTGNVTLTGVGVTDPKVPTVTCPVTTLAPGASTTCTGSMSLTQTDIDAGAVYNTATAAGAGPTGTWTPTATDSNATPLTPGRAISLDKQAGTPTGNTVGSTIPYTFLVTNTGTVSLNGIWLADSKLSSFSCPVSTLAPQASTTCTGTYTITQADLDAGSVVNTATVTGYALGTGLATSATDGVTVVLTRTGTMTLDKQVGTPTGQTAGSTIPYSFVVTNTGNVTLTSLTITDAKVAGANCPTTTLAPGVSTTCTATYTLTQADVDSGHVANNATASATPPAGMTPPSASDSTDLTITRTTAITLDKVAGTPTGNAAGSTIAYTFAVTNTGNVTLNAVGVTDAKVGTVTCPVTTLAPGAATLCVATYPITQGDVDAGQVLNTASATGTPPSGMTGPTASDSTTTPISRTPAITLDKQAGVPSGNAAGSTIAYIFAVTNTGNVTLTAVGVSDPTVGSVSCPAATLAPGAATTCTATYTLTQADVDAGTVHNSATATGTAPAGVTPATVSATDTTDSSIASAPAITLDKLAGFPDTNVAGGTIDYSFVVTNTGNVTLTSVTVTDAKVGTVSCPVAILAPTASMTCTASYTLTQADVDAGFVHNTAGVSGVPPTGSAVTALDSVTVTIGADPTISLDKQAAAPSGDAAGATIEYAFVVTNTGNQTLSAIVVTDPKVGAVSCPGSALAPGASMTCAATYTVTQVDVDAGMVNNTATVSGKPPVLDAVTDDDSTSTGLIHEPSISLDKQAGAPSGDTPGSMIAYTFVVANTGNVTLTAVSVSDPLAGAVSCPVTVLAPGGSTTCTASYTLTQTDVDAGKVANTATTAGTPPTGEPVTAQDSIEVPITARPSISMDKQAGTPSGNTAGSTIDYQFVVTNTGNLTLSSVAVNDPKVGVVGCPATTLAPGATTTCTATYPLTQADLDAGHVANTATVSGNAPQGLTPPTASDSTDTTLSRTASITLDKTAGTPSGSSAGSTIAYSFLVTNTGTVTLTGIVVTDARVGTVTCPVTILAPGAGTTCVATYPITQADIDSGQVLNNASVTGTPPSGMTRPTASDSTTATLTRTPGISLDKSAGTPSGSTAGSTIAYSFLVTNSGNVTLAAVGVSDPKVGAVTCPATSLAPGVAITCTATYHLTQADVDAGTVVNNATATGTPPTGLTAPTASDTTTTDIPASPGIDLTKSAGTPSGSFAGATIAYSFAVHNTGNVTLHGLVVTDPQVATVSCPVTLLAPGATTTCTGTHTITQAELDAGAVVNSASATANPPTGSPVTHTSSITTPLPRTPGITLDKQAGTPTGNLVGDTIGYSFVVRNSGNVTLNPIVVTDPKVGAVSCPVGSLAPGALTTCTATYVLAQADLDAGHVANSASASGTPPAGLTAPLATDSTDTPVSQNPKVSLDKQAGTPSGNSAGDSITFTFVVTNTGNVTLEDTFVQDPKVGDPSCPSGPLAPGASVSCTRTYLLTQADVDTGHVANTANVVGLFNGVMTAPGFDSTDTPITAGPAITLDKQDSAPSGNTPGATIDYTFAVTNTGNVTLHSVALSDPKLGPVSCLATTLAPAAATTCAASYTLTQADIDAGHVDNAATVSGTPPGGAPVTAADTTHTVLTRTPGLTLDKQAGAPTGHTAGSTIAYTFLVSNSGNVTLSGPSVTDPQVPVVACAFSTLAPGATATCTGTHTITQAEVDAGHVANSATATATAPGGATPSATDVTDTLIAPAPAITLDKTAGTPSGNAMGATIDYSFVVTNTGNVTLSAVAVSDPTVGTVSCPVTALVPGARATCTATYPLTQADVDRGRVDNTATASGTPPTGDPVTGTDTVTTPITRTAALTLAKTAGTPTGDAAGDTVGYTFLVTNTGNVTLTGVGVADPQVSAVSCPLTTLVPGQSTTCTAAHTITQAEADAGEVLNTATASGAPPAGVTRPAATDDATVALTRTPGIALDKQSGGVTDVDGNGQDEGDTISYTFLVQNTGTVTLASISISDPIAGPVTCPVTTLAPGATTVCAATRTLNQADVDAGHVLNTATVSGTPPIGLTPPTASDFTDTPIAAAAAISVDKQAGTPSGSTAGATLPYTFVVTNTGALTLDTISVDDPTVGPVTCPGGVLLPGESTTCSATYTLTQADVDAGSVANTATANGTPPGPGVPVSATDSTFVAIPRTAAISLDKSAGPPSGNAAGDTIGYTFTVTNAGTVTLTGVHVSDPLAGSVSCPSGPLAPGASMTCTATYLLIQSDVDAGHVANTATATGTPPAGLIAPTASDSTDSLLSQNPQVSLDKQAGPLSGNSAGDSIVFTFVVTNTGNVTLEDTLVEDPTVGDPSCPRGPLAPGASVSCTRTYTLTQADVDAGHFDNTASVTGLFNGVLTAPAFDSTATPITADPAITLDKQAGSPSGHYAGDEIDYAFVVVNTGNVTLSTVSVSDPKVGPVACPATSLAPGASTTCTATYPLTQADVDAAVVNNTATASGRAPTGTEVTASDSTSTLIPADASVIMDKQAGTPSANVAGGTVQYAFVITNDGNVTLSLLSVTDVVTGAVSCPQTTLLPGETTTCTATYTLTQVDVDSGQVANSATVTVTTPSGSVISGTDSTTATVPAGAAISLDKQAAAPTGNTTGSTIGYTFVVTNTGNVTLSPVGINDPKVGAVSCPVTTVAPGASVTCSATYTLTQADVDATEVDNTATASGTPPTGPAVTATDSTHTTITAAPSLTLDKTAGTLTGNRVGDTIDYTFLIVNTGNVTLYDGGLDDPMVGPVSCPVVFLTPGTSTTCTATYTLTQADVDAGHVANTATATALLQTGDPVTVSDSTDTPIPADPALTLDKQAGSLSGHFAGDGIDYAFVVTNSGTVTLTSVSVSDPMVGTVSCPVSSLAPGASMTCSATYVLTQADVDAGVVDNTATAAGTPPVGPAVTASDSTSTPIPAAPTLTLDKQAGTPSGNTAGSKIDYAFVVTNTGNVTLFGGGINDPTVGAVSCPVSSLLPGGTTTCTAVYTLTQADVDAGHVANTAIAWGTSPGGPVSATDSTDTPIVPGPAISLVKTAGAPAGDRAGETIGYSFVVTNSGNVTLSAVAVADPTVGAVTCPVTVLAPGESVTCTATYALTLADVDAGRVDNSATASGMPPAGIPVEATDVVSTPIPAAPAIDLVKTAGAPAGNRAGDAIGYSFVVTNTGNVTLSAVGVSDPLVAAVSCPGTMLAPAASMTCTASHILTQADVDAGVVDNTATSVGTPPTGAVVTATDSTSTPIPAAPALTLDKQAGLPSASTAGSTIAYTFIARNTGNVTLHAVAVSDPTAGPVTCPVATLAPGATTTCTATYTVTQVDVDAGHVANTATAWGTPPAGGPVNATDATDTPIITGPAIGLDKQAGTPSGNTVGSTIAYSFVVTNTGNVTLHALVVSDPMVGAVDCPATTLAPQAVTTCTATYTLTLADVDAGVVDNSATVSGTSPTGVPVTATDATSTPVPAAPVVTLEKQAGTPSGSTAGSTIAYTFLVTNTGNVTLHDVAVSDPTVGTVDCPATSLAPGVSVTCTAAYTLTQPDVDAGHVVNNATASGTPPIGAPVTATDSTDTPVTAAPSILLEKSAGAPSGTTAGSTIDYSFLVTNTGNVTLHAVAVSDPMVGTVTCLATTLAPGATTTCAATYPLTQADVDAGVVDNSATVAGTPPVGAPVGAADATSTPIPSFGSTSFDKRAGTPSGNAAGATIPYTFVVTNTGNVTLDPVTVSDPLVLGAGDLTCGGALAPGASASCTATYTLTQADVDAGHVANTASVTGEAPDGTLTTPRADNTDTPIVAGPAITLDKRAGALSGTAAGSTIDYAFDVANTGNVTLDPISVSDPKAGAVTCPVTALAPGEATTCTVTYPLTQADVDAGTVDNTATASGTPPTGAPVTATDSVSTPIAPAPAVTLLKQAGAPSGNTAGSTIAYTFEVTNTGNVTLDPISVTDPLVGTVTCPVTSLAPNAATTCTGTYTLTQADVDAGTVDNTATAHGNPPAGDPGTTADDASATSSVSTPILAAPGIDLVKTGTAHGDRAGDPVDYTFEVTNTGNVTLTAVGVADPLVGTVTCPETTLAPLESTTCTGTYTLTQADVDAGVVHNEATASGTPPAGAAVAATDAVDVPVTPGPYVSLDKRAGTPSGSAAGSTIDYTFVVTNTGNVTLTTVAVSDPTVGPVACPDDTLAAGASMTCTATYVISAADLDAGEVVNTASVSGLPPTGAAVTDEDAVTSPLAQLPSISLVKSADVTSELGVGDQVSYTFVITNTGNVTLTGVALGDPMLAAVTCPATTLAAGESMVCTADPYTVTKADAARGRISNHASVTGSFCPAAGCRVVAAADTLVVTTARVEDAGGGGLALTGFGGGPIMLAGGGILALGLLLLVAARRRRS